jgi:hypothetical protein
MSIQTVWAGPEATSAEPDPLALARSAHEQLAQLKDSVALFRKTERIDGKLQPTQTAEIKVRCKPYSVYMKWVEQPYKGRQVVYQEGRFQDKLIANVGDLFGFGSVFALDPEGPEATKGNRHPITEAGIQHITERLYEQFNLASADGSLRARFLGAEDFAGRPTFKIMRVLDDGGYRYWNIDTELLLPIRVATYDADFQLLETYSFSKLRLNVGLTDDDFDPQKLW